MENNKLLWYKISSIYTYDFITPETSVNTGKISVHIISIYPIHCWFYDNFPNIISSTLKRRSLQCFHHWMRSVLKGI